ncbi:cyclin-like protein [Infundibulicybe gibba]|nr:cyclin-like protein [Infundibulicybe gibba]
MDCGSRNIEAGSRRRHAYVDEPEKMDFLAIFFANVISKLGKKLQFRQRVIATATVFFRRFYLKNSYCETDPFLVISACCYVAAKAEEHPVHIKTVVAESRALFSQNYGVKRFPTDNSKLAEMEFYLVDDLECDLTVFHPYRTLLTLCRKDDTETEEGEPGELGVGVGADDGPRYWGTGEGQLELAEGALQTAWFIVNDTYRSELCLLYPPHLIAIAAIYLTFILHTPTRAVVSAHLSSGPASSASTSQPQPRRSSRQAHAADSSKKTQDPISFLVELNVSMPLIATIAQEIISLYSLWDRYKEDATPEAPKAPAQSPFGSGTTPSRRGASGSMSGIGTPTDDPPDALATPVSLSALLLKMRETRLMDLARRPVAINKMLERTQAAG